MTQRIARSDWVATRAQPSFTGFVLRVARDGSWADVRWSTPYETWTKRMPTANLIAQHTIPLADGWTVTDETRRAELESEARTS
jgi:hypothetical protein